MATTPLLKHKGHPKKIIPGPYGIHAGKIICLKCNGAFVKWASKNQTHRETEKLGL